MKLLLDSNVIIENIDNLSRLIGVIVPIQAPQY